MEYLKDIDNLVKLWDNSLTKMLPDEITCGSHYVAWWHCDICGYSYPREVQNQVKIYRQRGTNNICPICRGKRVIPGFNSLKARHPDIVEAE